MSVSTLALALAIAATTVTGQSTFGNYGNYGSPFPDTTYPNATSPNPLVAQGAQINQTSPEKFPSPWGRGQGDWESAYSRARELVAQMTLEEKVNLTTGVGWESERCVGETGSVPRLGIRGLCLQDSPLGVRDTDFVSVFPAGVNVAQTWDRGLAYQRGVGMGAEHRDKGVDVQLGPVAGPLGRTPEAGRNWEGFSPDPWLTGVLFADTIKGIQSQNVMACAKHYIMNEQEHFRQIPESAGYGFNITDPVSMNVDDQTMHELYLWPFAEGVRAGVASVMCSYNQINNSHGCQNSYTQNYLLKNELDFQGFIMSDWQATYSGVYAILSGLDMTMPGDIVFNDGATYFGTNLTIAVLNGSVPQWRVDDMTTRILAAWYYVGRDTVDTDINFSSWTRETFGYRNYYGEQSYELINEHRDVRQEHRNVIRQIAADSTILLKNTNGALPLTGREKLTAVFGEDAGECALGPNGISDRGGDCGSLGIGWGSGTADFTNFIVPDTALGYEAVMAGRPYESITNNSALTQIQTLAHRTAEVGGVCLVFANADSGEGYIQEDQNFGDRKNLTFWQGVEPVIANVTANCNNTVLVIHSPGALEIGAYKNNPNVTAILWAGMPGEQSGNAIADILYGRVNPGAKLPFTLGDTRSDYGADVLYTVNQPVPQIQLEEGVFIDYRAFDRANITPVYEFGYGMSYTSFSYSNLQVTNLHAGPYVPTTGQTTEAPTYGTINNDSSAYLFPDNLTRPAGYIYPYLSSANLSEAYNGSDYGRSYIDPASLDSSPQPLLPAGGAPGGNPGLYDVLYRVQATITNTGSRPGDEVPQLYVNLGGPYDPKVVLRGFQRLSIQPNGTAIFSADLTRKDLSNWDTNSQNWVVTNSTKTVYVGSSSRKLPLSARLA
ncbi:putative beta-glucosidase A-1 [Elsinoe australis]|uniref:beta-glucosidase n=1 Tax=Elsinoe australis TaxID=40998 RepID=A0A4U7BG44_9PEZI|nr:putative beta-glucosidase A-1 [Elsinoe australis]